MKHREGQYFDHIKSVSFKLLQREGISEKVPWLRTSKAFLK